MTLTDEQTVALRTSAYDLESAEADALAARVELAQLVLTALDESGTSYREVARVIDATPSAVQRLAKLARSVRASERNVT